MQMTTDNNAISKERNSSVELLRIAAMVMIIFHHFAVHGGFNFDDEIVTIPKLWYNLIVLGGKTGVDIFVLISGYFLIEETRFRINLKKIAKFWGQIVFYSVSITLIFAFCGKIDLDKKEIIRALSPIISNKWWFASTYFILYLIHPFINKCLRKINKKKHQNLAASLLIFWCILPMFQLKNIEIEHLIWFVILYCIASYIKLYGLNLSFKSKHYSFFFFLFLIITYSSPYIFNTLKKTTDIPSYHSSYINVYFHFFFYTQNILTQFLIALSLFMAFVTLKHSYKKWINTIASTTFGIYLIHDDDFVRPFLWLNTFKNASYQNNSMIIIYSVIAVFIVFVLCSLIDLVRQKTIEKAYMYFVIRYINTIIKPFQILYKRIKIRIFDKDKKKV